MKYFFIIISNLLLFMSCSIGATQKVFLTRMDVKEDCKLLKKYLRYGYIAYDENLTLNSELERIDEAILKDVDLIIKKQKKIEKKDFERIISDELKKNILIEDLHLNVMGENQNYPVFNHNSLYFTEIYLKKENNKFLVMESTEDDILEGKCFTGNERNLFMTIRNGNICWRYGVGANVLDFILIIGYHLIKFWRI